MSKDVTITINADLKRFNISADEAKAKADAIVKEWKIQRALIIQQVREAFHLIGSLISTIRQAMSLFGQQIDPFFSSLVSMVMALTSMLLSSATVLTATGIFAPVGAVLFGLAVSFNILTMAKLVSDKIHTEGVLDQIMSNLSDMGRGKLFGTGMGGFM
jgi:hypothetical protein